MSRESSESAAAAARELDSLIELYPESGWPLYYRGRLSQWTAAGQALIRQAAELFATQSDISGEIRSRADLVTLLGIGRELTGSFAELENLRRLAELSPLDEDRATVDIAEAHYRMLSGVDLTEAYSRLRDALSAFEQAPDGYYFERRECLRALSQITCDLGILWEANDWAAAAVELAHQQGTLRDQATASYDAVVTGLRSELPSPSGRRQWVAQLQDTVAMAVRAEHDWIEASSRLLLAELLGGAQAGEHLEHCLRIAVELSDADLERACLLAQATYFLEADPEGARLLLDQTYAAGWGPWTPLHSWADRMRVLWSTRSPSEAFEGATTILSAIEAFRRNQVGETSDLLLSASADAYYWISGRLLEGDPSPEDIQLSFSTMERLRAQTLRETLERREVSVEPPTVEWTRHLLELEQLNSDYADVYRALLDRRLTVTARRKLLSRLTDLERREARIQRRAAAFLPERPPLEPPDSELLGRVRSSLADDEALLSYQLGQWEGWDGRFLGGSWLTVVTGAGASVYRLQADRAVLENMLGILLGLQDPDLPEALALLYAELLDPALAELPAAVSKLIVVPDGALHVLPFSLLRERIDGPPLVERFEIQTVPSAGLWLHWRAAAGTPDPEHRQALVLANPAVPATASPAAVRSWAFDSATTLGALPHAEREGRQVLRHLGGIGRLVSGRSASESLLKSEDLSRFSILHFASHAVVNPVKPGRSAVMLAAGSDEEDGFLRPSEIARLDGLDGKLVVLSACDTAAGSVLRGEGVLSLGRAFFEAGAQAVVGSLWRLDDRLATRFFDDFYSYLRKGLTVSEALAETQRKWARRGRPAAIWAGIVVLGNGNLVPVPGGVRASWWRPAAALVGLLLLGVVAVLLQRRRRRSRLAVG